MSILKKFLMKEEKSFTEEIEYSLIEAISILKNNYNVELASLNIDVNDEEILITYDSWGIDTMIKLGVDYYNEIVFLKEYKSGVTDNFDKLINPYSEDYPNVDMFYKLIEAMRLDWGIQRENQ